MLRNKTTYTKIFCIALQSALGMWMLLGIISVQGVFAGGVQTLDTVEVTDSAEDLVGSADSSTEGTVTSEQIQERPIVRTGEFLETVPGVVVSQHSGEGKANQYYLRGFNLDHGTDLAISVENMPVNMPTHGHGQGYADINFVIPELVSGIQYKKGPYYADEGDFSAAGAIHMEYMTALEHNFAELTYGSDNYQRGLFAGSHSALGGDLLFGVELFYNDGPWDHPENFRKFNGLLRYTRGTQQNRFSIMAMAYRGDWDSTDQVAQRAIESGLISRFGTLDPSSGGETYRYSLIGEWERTGEGSATRASAYVSSYGLNLFSNFTYFLDFPAEGDQFEQADKRILSGLKASQTWFGTLAGREMDNTVGLQVRNDNISEVGLHRTTERDRFLTIREDDVLQTSYGVYFQNGFKWAEKLRTVAGIRADFYTWDVESNIPANSGKADDSIISPKLSVILGPWAKTEFYINGGYGFHSNDGRGSTITVDPVAFQSDPTCANLPVDDPDTCRVSKVDPLVAAKGAEIGLRTAIIPRLQSQFTFWVLEIDSELLFIGDAGNTEATRPSRRTGIEWANYYTPTSWLILDLDVAYSQARFDDSDPAGDRIPGSPEGVISAGATLNDLMGFLASVRVRYFGPRPLVEDNSVRSDSSTLVNARVGYEFFKSWRIVVDVLNVFDAEDSDIDYFYESSIPAIDGVGGSAEDIHTHPVNPREVRVALTATF
ncbi:MAG: TonB-dependent receptor [Candidatus Manganitrophus sp.]|nr:TonB-dependent receptor [Candidatus Manganitrophus sp.]